MTKSTRARYTLEFKEEAVRLVTRGERVATVAKNLGLSEQTLHNWVKAANNGGLKILLHRQSARSKWKSVVCEQNCRA
jgi:transposase